MLCLQRSAGGVTQHVVILCCDPTLSAPPIELREPGLAMRSRDRFHIEGEVGVLDVVVVDGEHTGVIFGGESSYLAHLRWFLWTCAINPNNSVVSLGCGSPENSLYNVATLTTIRSASPHES